MAQKQSAILVSALIITGLLGSVAWVLNSAPATDPAAVETVPEPVVPDSVPDLSSMAETGALPPLPPELEGLEPEASLDTDENGNLIPSHELRVLFDFFLANIDREPLANVLQRIRRSLDGRLAEPANSQALSLLERYVGYRMSIEELQDQQEAGVTTDGFELDTLKQRQQNLQALRQKHFARQEIDAFFAEDEQLDHYTLARIEIQQDASLSDAEKQRQLQQLDYQLPETVRLARKRAVIHGDIYQQARQLKASGASDSEIYAVRATELGEEAATQLARLDREQNQWQQRLTHYRQERTRILEAGLSETDRSTAIDNLRDDLFTGPERLRVRALDADQR